MKESDFNELAEEIATESNNEMWESRAVLRSIANELNARAVAFQLETNRVVGKDNA